MITRIVLLMLIAVLALPVAMLTAPGETNQAPWSDSAVAAKGKKSKQSKKPKSKTVTHTVRQPVTQTFTSSGPITIPAGAPGTTSGKAAPYPSAIAVSGFTNGTITDVNLILNDFSHTAASDVDVLLSTSDGRQALVLSDVDSRFAPVDVDLTLDDEATASMPAVGDGVDLTSGAFRPTNHTYNADTFVAPAPNPNGTAALSSFDGADPNGTWQLWAMDNANGDVGNIESWSLQITAEVDVQVQEPGKAKKTKNKKGKGGKKGKR